MKLHQSLELKSVNDLKQQRALIPTADRSTRKDDIIAAIERHLLSADLGPLWERLSQLEVDAVAEAVHNWDGRFDATRFQAR